MTVNVCIYIYVCLVIYDFYTLQPNLSSICVKYCEVIINSRTGVEDAHPQLERAVNQFPCHFSRPKQSVNSQTVLNAVKHAHARICRHTHADKRACIHSFCLYVFI